jgi:hypothetical protein
MYSSHGALEQLLHGFGKSVKILKHFAVGKKLFIEYKRT